MSTTEPGVAGEGVITRRRLEVRGQVQGVGFRPFVYRLAVRQDLGGWVLNVTNGATIEVEGPPEALAAFERLLLDELPPLARITALHSREVPPLGETVFHIRQSCGEAGRRPEVTPDAATCSDCLRELFDPADRRHRYAFINCTNCGPRYSIIRDVPYDRPQTTMAVFRMCPDCQREYDDPSDRRFHAQPNACDLCGPQLRLVLSGRAAPTDAKQAAATISGDEALQAAARMLRDGAVVAVKGIGGYHLACRADSEEVVRRLRERKLRDGKPLAIMVPDLAIARRLCHLTPTDEEALLSPAAPIVLASKADRELIAPSVAPGCADYGIMLPYAPVHYLLFRSGLGPLVMTSANLAGQPLTYRDDDALRELSDVADAFLLHNREIFRPIDDSVVQTFRGAAVPVRRARGYAPRPVLVATPPDSAARILALGGELKATVCLLSGSEAILSEHLGDLTRPETYRHYVQAIERLRQLFDFSPQVLACDMHPRYLSTEYARQLGLPTVAVQHHHAHIASVQAEWGEAGPVIGLACDGTGFGTDHAVWGCELLLCERGEYRRLGHLEYCPLVGGDVAALETWRPAAAWLRAAYGQDWVERFRSLVAKQRHAQRVEIDADKLLPGEQHLPALAKQIERGVNCPPTSSLGRVFDAAAFLLGLCYRNRHEAEAAMALEALAGQAPADAYPFELINDDAGRMHWSLRPTIRAMVEDCLSDTASSVVAARFHETITQMLATGARLAARQRSVRKVALSGGCFANRRLLTRLVETLEADGFTVLYHRCVPCGDGGLSLGQAWVAAWRLTEGRCDQFDRPPSAGYRDG